MKSKSVLILNSILLISLCGCNHTHTEITSPANTNPPVVVETKTQKSACDKMLEAIQNDSNLQTANLKTIPVERQFQRVIRKDCIGNITSDQIETVKSPTFLLDIKSNSEKPFKSVLIYNQPTCDHKLTSMPIENPILFGSLIKVTGDGKNKIQIKGDLAEALFTFKFSQGENQLYVRYFYDCSPSDFEGNIRAVTGNSSCAKSNEYKTIIFPISIIYSESTLAGAKVIEANTKDCK